MIKNGRPYTIESGFDSVDDALITDLEAHEIDTVGKWIKENIRGSRKIYKYSTSYGLKHILNNDTGIYLTNNQFKDALLLAGYNPVDPNELNWRYKIILVKEVNYNPSLFFKWLKKYESDKSYYGDFASDVARDFSFPVFANCKIIRTYLEHKGACDNALKAFNDLWLEYCREKGETEAL